MDKILKPNILELHPDDTNAERTWRHWLIRFKTFISSLESPSDSDKFHILTNLVSAEVYDLFRETETYEDALSTLSTTYVKSKTDLFLRHQLRNQRQSSNQTIDQFIRHIESLGRECPFEAVTAQNHRDLFLRDTFVAGINSPIIRQRLLEAAVHNKAKAYELARTLEDAHTQASHFTEQSNLNMGCESMTINELHENIQEELPCQIQCNSVERRKCYFCGDTIHKRDRCPAKNITCRTCGKLGHFARVCKSKRQISTGVHSVLGSTSFFQDSAATLPTIQICIKGVSLNALIDTGSALNLIRPDISTLCKLTSNPSTIRVSMANTAFSTKLRQFVVADISADGRPYKNIKFHILSSLCSDVILGRPFLSRHNSLLMKFNGSEPCFTIGAAEALTVESPQLFKFLDESIHPIATKSRRRNPYDEKFIDSQIKQLLSDEIIEPSQSPWRAQVLIVNQNQKRRMVVDYSETVNKFTQLDAFPLPRIDDFINKLAPYSFYSCLDLKSAYHQILLRSDERHYTAFEANGSLYHFNRLPFGLTNAVPAFQRVINGIINREKLTDTYAYLDDVVIGGRSKEQHDSNLKRFLNVATKYNITLNNSKCVFASSCIRILGYQISKGKMSPDPNRVISVTSLEEPKNAASLKRIVGLFAYYSSWIKDFSKLIRPLIDSQSFPLSHSALKAFHTLKERIAEATLSTIDFELPFTIETDASERSIGACLSQNSKPVAFFSRSLDKNAKRFTAIEKEALAIVEALRYWRHYLYIQPFKIITDQRSVSYMFSAHNNKIKNDKILRWRLELSQFKFDIQYRAGKLNHAADALSRDAFCNSVSFTNHDLQHLRKVHSQLCHPGITRLWHFVQKRNLPFSLSDVRNISSECKSCAILKPRFFRPPEAKLIKSSMPFERLSMDFKGPIPTKNNKRYLLTVIDEYSRFPFAFPCSDMTTHTVIDCLTQIFSIFGSPASIHSDQGTAFTSKEIQSFLSHHGVAITHSSSYNPAGNGQVERLNGVLWKAISLRLHDLGKKTDEWQSVLPQCLNAIRSLLCTATNHTPHERLFTFSRRSINGHDLPSWLSNPGPVLIRRFNKTNKYENPVEKAEIVYANPNFALVKLQNGREIYISTRHLSPYPRVDENLNINSSDGDIPFDLETLNLYDGDKMCDQASINDHSTVNSNSHSRSDKRSDEITVNPENLDATKYIDETVNHNEENELSRQDESFFLNTDNTCQSNYPTRYFNRSENGELRPQRNRRSPAYLNDYVVGRM